MKHYNQWINWGIVDGRKVPLSPLTGRMCDAHDPTHHVTYELAKASGANVAFVFTENDPFFFVDIDGCLEATGWSQLAMEICDRFPSASREVSQSGRGLHLFGKYTSIPAHACKNTALHLELYHTGRFVAFTGNGYEDVEGDSTTELHRFIADYMQERAASVDTRGWTDTPVEGATPIPDDGELLKAAMKSNSLFGKATFKQLWECDTDALSKAYPSQTALYDGSSADLALLQHLAFWTGNDCERMKRLVFQSALRREKWDNRDDYITMSILTACRLQTRWYAKVAAVDDGDMFGGCVYIVEEDKVLTADGDLLNKSQFNGVYGTGAWYPYTKTGKATQDAYKAFMVNELKVFPRAKGLYFNPREAHRALDSRGRINTYREPARTVTYGNAAPFVTHIEKLLPDANDRDVLLSYMAACVQRPGVKFTWCPVLQGVPGNGKSMVTACMAYAVGLEYTHTAKSGELTGKFNGWMDGTLLVIVDDVHINDDVRMEDLKPLITQRHLEIQYKGRDQVMKEVFANFMMTTNLKDAIRKDRDDRRFCVMLSAQQSADDLLRDGMTGSYFNTLWSWLGDGGYADVTGYLMTYPINPAYDPSGNCTRAPEVSTTEEVIKCGIGVYESMVLEAIESEVYGFRGGWVSAYAVDMLIPKITPRRRGEVLTRLGFHHVGKTPKIMPLEGGKRVALYNRDKEADVTKYEGDQNEQV